MLPALALPPAHISPSRPSPRSASPIYSRRNNYPAVAVASPAKHPSLELLKHRLIRLADAGRLDDAISTLDAMAQRGVPADLVSYSVLLKFCIRTRDLHRGRLVHRRLLDSGLELDAVVANSLITLYSKCGHWAAAETIFREMGAVRDVVSWTAMVSCAARSGREGEAIKMFCEMLESGSVVPNEFTFCGVVQACCNSDYISTGMVVLGFVLKMGFFLSDASVGCSLIDMFVKCSDIENARKVFNGMCEKNVVAWTLMITRYTQHGRTRDAIDLFLDMVCNGFEPDQFTMSSVISACAETGSFQLGQQLHSLAIKAGLDYDVCVGCSLIDMYAKCEVSGSMYYSNKVFDHLEDHNVMSWTALISGYVHNGRNDEKAIELFCKMINMKVQPNHFTYSTVIKACANLSDLKVGVQVHSHVIKRGLAAINFVGNSLVSLYARSGGMEDACKAFDLLYEKNMVSYNSIVDGYVKNGNSEEAFKLIHQIENMDCGANAFSFASLLSAAASVGLLSKGQQLHAQLLKSGFQSDKGVSNSLISMYSRCGNIDDACKAFDEMEDRNVISWTSMITGFAKHGYANQAIRLFNDMISTGIKPNEVTYIAVLSACSHAGLVDKGWEYFYSMQKYHGIVPRIEHYVCMVDLLGRSGLLEEAIVFINSMPFEPDAVVWKTLLSACIIQGDLDIGQIAAKNILELEPHDPAAYVLLSNLYADAGKWEVVAEIRKSMKEKNINKDAGLSWIEIENIIHKFHVGDTSHPQAKQIYAKLDELLPKIKNIGYTPNTNFVLHDVEDELKEQYLFQHSEKIAVAFGLISTSAPKPIRVLKNLRVCGDCHNAIKYISKVTDREVILRDSNRFHHISNGECSCRDYW